MLAGLLLKVAEIHYSYVFWNVPQGSIDREEDSSNYPLCKQILFLQNDFRTS
jgi:hypothetical protein